MHKFTETTHRSVAWLKKTNDEGQLEMRPPFQRNPVWSNKQKGALIETILLEYPIPEIYMQDVVSEDGAEKHIVVDGQQRIRSVLDFIDGEFEIEEEGFSWEDISFDDLSSDDKKKIFEYKFVTRILPTIPDEEIRSIFQRINRNTVTLNAQELRHATYWGAFIKLMESLSDLEFWSRAEIFSANDRRRMLDTEYVSELAVAYLNGLQNKKTKLEYFYQLYEKEFDDAEKLNSVFFEVLGEIGKLIPNIRDTRFRKKSDFYTLFLIFAEYEALLPLSAEVRSAVSAALLKFAADVNRYLSDSDSNFSPEVVQYAKNVERAASDLGSRRARHDALKKIIDEAMRTHVLEV